MKILKFFDVDLGWKKFGSGNRDGKKSDAGSGINITDPQHCCLQYIGWAKMSTISWRNLCKIIRKVHANPGWPQMWAISWRNLCNILRKVHATLGWQQI
jgi:hypothetical protein